MAIQSISGADAVPQGVMENSRVYNEQANRIENQNVENQKTGENSRSIRELSQEENKGAWINTTA